MKNVHAYWEENTSENSVYKPWRMLVLHTKWSLGTRLRSRNDIRLDAGGWDTK